MADRMPSAASPRASREIPVQKPRWAFWKGLLTGVALEIPVLAATVWVVARLGIGDARVDFMMAMRMTALFAGIAAVLTAGGIGRLAAYSFVERGRKRAIFAAMRAHAMASTGLVVIAAIPHGGIDFARWTWLGLPCAGLVAGALCGAVIGIVCTGAAPVGLADVWSLTRKPTDALRQLLSPADLVRLGNALRTRTSTLFEGIFEPAAPPPKAEPPSAPESQPVAAPKPRVEGDRPKVV